MGDTSCAEHFYGIQLPEDAVINIIDDETSSGEGAQYKELKANNLKYFVSGCHVSGEDNIHYVGKFSTHVWQWEPKKTKHPNDLQLKQANQDIKNFCKAIGIKYEKPAWWLISFYG